eukprot:TRINITY_DN25630_c0_g3_i2.p1 TRINITY_DN25630_c0_g3~~TRINITY_DN25630_c0_g3_i2.p1  ORF type:complete len:344 (-),score=60.92 TRINITY_DN25630_c0_g3_i2:146-1177(-)
MVFAGAMRRHKGARVFGCAFLLFRNFGSFAIEATEGGGGDVVSFQGGDRGSHGSQQSSSDGEPNQETGVIMANASLLQAHQLDPGVDAEVDPIHWTLRGLLSWLLWVVLAIVVVRFAYVRKITPTGKITVASQDDIDIPQRTFTNGRFECFDDVGVLFWSFVCPAVRWADNLDIGGFLSFWKAFALFVGLGLLNNGVLYNGMTFVVLTLIGLCVFAFISWRQHSYSLPTSSQEVMCSTPWILAVALVFTAAGVVVIVVGPACQEMLSAYMSLYGTFTFGIFTSAIMVYYRQHLRMDLGLEHGTCHTVAEDCCFVFWFFGLVAVNGALVVPSRRRLASWRTHAR